MNNDNLVQDELGFFLTLSIARISIVLAEIVRIISNGVAMHITKQFLIGIFHHLLHPFLIQFIVSSNYIKKIVKSVLRY